MGAIRLTDFGKYYDANNANHVAAFQMLQEQSPESLMVDEAQWVLKYREKAPAPPAPAGICTAELMHRLTGYAANTFDKVFVDDCNRLFADTGFDKHLDAMQMLMANMMHETCNFLYMQELASGAAYNGRADLGNTSPGDGQKYKGAGVLMLTGKFNYTRLSDAIKDPKVMDGCDYVASTYPFTSALTWIEENNLLSVCLNQGFDDCCKQINGGWNGYEDRKAKYAICQREMRL